MNENEAVVAIFATLSVAMCFITVTLCGFRQETDRDKKNHDKN